MVHLYFLEHTRHRKDMFWKYTQLSAKEGHLQKLNNCNTCNLFNNEYLMVMWQEELWPCTRKHTQTTFRFLPEFHLQLFEKLCVHSNDLVTRSLKTPTHSNDLVTRLLKTPTRSNNLVTCSLKTLTRLNNLVNRLLETPTCSNDLTTCLLETVTRSNELVTHSQETPTCWIKYM